MKFIGSVILYFVLIFAFSWIGGKIFYDFNSAVFLLFDGHIFKGLCTLAIMFIAYLTAAIMTVAKNDYDDDSGRFAAFIIFAVLVYLTGSDIYAYYKNAKDFFDGAFNIFGYLLVSVDDLMKILTLGLALKE